MEPSMFQINTLSATKLRPLRLWLAAIPLLLSGAAAHAAVSPNTGSLGSAADGTHNGNVTFGPGAVTAGGDQSAVYDGVAGTNTVVPFQSALNPAAASPFTVEFW